MNNQRASLLAPVVLAMVLTYLLYLVPLVRSLVWLNAAALALALGSPKYFMAMGVAELLVISAFFTDVIRRIWVYLMTDDDE